MTRHELALLIATGGGISMAGMILRIIIGAINEKPKDNNSLPEQDDLPVPRPFGVRKGR